MSLSGGSPFQTSGYCREALPDVRECSGGPTGCPGVGEALLNVREWSGGPPGCPGVVGKPYRTSRSGGRPCRMSGRHCGCPGVVGSPSRMSRSGPEALLDVWEWSGGTPGCSEVIGRPFRMCGMPIGIFGRPRGCPGVVRRPSLMSGSGQESLPHDRGGREFLPDVWEWSGDAPR